VKGYLAFLEKYPNSKFGDLANGKLKETQEAVKNDEIASAWQQAESNKTYQEFLRKYPDSRFSDLAKSKIEGLAQDVKNEELVDSWRVVGAWRKASTDNTIQAYQDFLGQYPNSKFDKLANIKLKKLTETPTVEEAQEPDNEQSTNDKMIASWLDIIKKNEPPLFAKFIEDYPDSIYVKLAQIKLANLENSFWLETQKNNSTCS
jgi:outer membrane protein assembly factor BamD (BamD/ComL family)